MNFKKILIAILLISLAEHSFSQDVTQAVYVRYNIVGSYKLADWKQDDFEKTNRSL